MRTDPPRKPTNGEPAFHRRSPLRVGPTLVRLTGEVVASVFRPTPSQEIDEELDFHIAMATRRNIRAGMSPHEARREAERRFGDLDHVKERCRRSGARRDRRMSFTEWFHDLGRDVRLSLRQLKTNPGFASVVVLTLALGMGANTAVFSTVNGVLLRPLPFPEPQELVRAYSLFLPESGYEGDRIPLSPREVIEYRRSTRALERISFYTQVPLTLTGDGGDPERLSAVAVDAELFPLLGVPPESGRWFNAEEMVPGHLPAAVLSYDLWTARFGSDPGIVGSSITLDGSSVEVVGVMPQGFSFPQSEEDIYLTFQHDPDHVGGWGNHSVSMVGRLAPGVTFDQAQDELAGFVEEWREEYGHPQVGHSIYLMPLRTAMVDAVSDSLWLLLGAVILVLLIAAANVANLLLARGEGRARELSLRMALGAGRFRIARQLLAESLVLVGLGAALGVALASAVVPAILRLNPDALPRAESIGLDLNVLLFTGIVAFFTAVLFGLAPVLKARIHPQTGELGSAARIAGSRRGKGVVRALIVGEVALSLLVAVSAGLMTRTLRETLSVDAGIEARGLLTFSLSLDPGGYPEPDDVRGGIATIIERLTTLPGVTAAGFASVLPLSGEKYVPDFLIEGRPRPQEGERMTSAVTLVVTPGYTEAMGVPLLQGRRFQTGDRHGNELVALISRETARVFWPDEDPIGSRIGFYSNAEETAWVTIVGIVENTLPYDLQSDPRPQIYLPHGQEQGFWARNERSGSVVLKTDVAPLSLTSSVRRVLAEVDPDLPIADVRTMQDIVNASVAEPRMASGLLGSFGALALLLAMVGIYGVVSYSVARRTREIGIRVALGAGKSSVVSLMVREGAAPALVGVVVGLLCAIPASSLLEGMLFGVSPTDPLTLALVAALLAGTSALASWVPSARATRIQPTEALRE